MKKLTHVVSFSGGRTSAYLVWLMERARKEFGWDVKYVFCDTGVEHPATYKFIRDIIKFWNIDLIILRAVVNPTLGQGNSYQQFEHRDLMNSAVMPPFEPFMSMMIKYGTPTALGPYCSERMKKDVTEAYCKDHFGKDNFVTWLGMRTDEPARLKPKKGIKYLADLIDIEKQDVLEWWRHQPFDLECEEWEGNCLLCVKKSSAKIALAARQNPHFYRMWKYHLEQKTVREKEGYDKLVMYRGRLSLDGIVQLYEGRTQADIFSRMKCQKRFETGSCTESCEAFKLEGEEINFNVVNQQVYKDFEIELENLQDQLELFAA